MSLIVPLSPEVIGWVTVVTTANSLFAIVTGISKIQSVSVAPTRLTFTMYAPAVEIENILEF